MEVIGDFFVLIGKFGIWVVFPFILFLWLFLIYGREYLIKIGIIEVEEKDSGDKPETEEERVLREKNKRELKKNIRKGNKKD